MAHKANLQPAISPGVSESSFWSSADLRGKETILSRRISRFNKARKRVGPEISNKHSSLKSHDNDTSNLSRTSIDSAEGSNDSSKDQRHNHGKRLKDKEKRQRTDNFFIRIRNIFADFDAYVARQNVTSHNLCIYSTLYMIPILVLVIAWDLIAVIILELPELSMINHPGFMMVFHFACMPVAMYGYMMRVLMGLDSTTLTHLALISVVMHPILIIIRATMEIVFDGYRSQKITTYEVRD